jgi:hypoxanthine phosphoribosyltransferase
MFNHGDFVSAAGLNLKWKIECDDLSNKDIECIANIAGQKYKFCDVVGVPRGGYKLATALKHYITPYSSTLLVVDDVWTTGGSMMAYINQLKQGFSSNSAKWITTEINWQGFVIFSRGFLQNNVDSLFQINRFFDK